MELTGNINEKGYSYDKGIIITQKVIKRNRKAAKIHNFSIFQFFSFSSIRVAVCFQLALNYYHSICFAKNINLKPVVGPNGPNKGFRSHTPQNDIIFRFFFECVLLIHF